MKRTILTLILLVSTNLYSQTLLNEVLDKKVDIEIEDGGLYISPNIVGILSGITFTSKFRGDYSFVSGNDLNFDIFQSGESNDVDGFLYKTYVGFGIVPMDGTSRIKVGQFDRNIEIVKDQFSRSVNGDYYLSINGVDVSGGIKKMDRFSFKDEVRIFPNPFNDQVSISNFLPGDYIQVYNMVGMLEIEEYLGNNNIINTSKLSPGSYLLRVVRDKTINTIIGIKSL